MSPSRQPCCLETQNVYGLLLGNYRYQTDRKIYYQSEIAVPLQPSRNLRMVHATKLTAAHSARIILSFGYLHETRTPTCTCYSYGILNILIRVKH